MFYKWKIKRLKEKKAYYLSKMEKAFHKVHKEILDYLKSQEEPTYFSKYLSTCMGTSDLPTFIVILEGIIEDSKKAEQDRDAIFARRFCQYAIFRIHWLSNFTMWWTTVKTKCDHCGNVISENFCYTNHICPICGAVLTYKEEK